MRYSFKVKWSFLTICILCLLLIGSPYIPQRTNNIIKLGIELVLIFVIGIRYSITRETIKRINPIFLFFGAMCFCTYLSHGVSSRFGNSLVTGGSYFLFYFVISMLSEKYSSEYVAGVIKLNVFVYMLILDFFVIVTLGKGLGGLDEVVYLLGNKFMLSYIHMIMLAFINFNNKRSLTDNKKLYRIIVFLIYSLVVCKVADTTTGMIGCIFVAMISILSIKRGKIIEFISKPFVVVVFFLGINVIFLLTDFVLNNSFFTSFFLNRSHTSKILSGRVTMYNISMNAIAENPIWGYGINYDIVRTTLSFGNPQNGLLKMMLDFGVIGTVLFLLVLYITFKNAYDDKKNNVKNYCIAFIYGMLFCSLVEINIAAIFMLICALLNGVNCNQVVKKKIRIVDI